MNKKPSTAIDDDNESTLSNLKKQQAQIKPGLQAFNEAINNEYVYLILAGLNILFSTDEVQNKKIGIYKEG